VTVAILARVDQPVAKFARHIVTIPTMGVSLCNVCVLVSVLSQAFAVHSPTQNGVAPDNDADGNMMQILDAEDEMFPQFPSFLAGCTSGNFNAKGSRKCTGIQGLQCDTNGGCTGTLQGKPYKINCNHRHECVTDSWGGTLVRKYMSTTSNGAVHWNNGCSWICAAATAARAECSGCVMVATTAPQCGAAGTPAVTTTAAAANLMQSPGAVTTSAAAGGAVDCTACVAPTGATMGANCTAPQAAAAPAPAPAPAPA
jgi:hypothetical protein